MACLAIALLAPPVPPVRRLTRDAAVFERRGDAGDIPVEECMHTTITHQQPVHRLIPRAMLSDLYATHTGGGRGGASHTQTG